MLPRPDFRALVWLVLMGLGSGCVGLGITACESPSSSPEASSRRAVPAAPHEPSDAVPIPGVDSVAAFVQSARVLADSGRFAASLAMWRRARDAASGRDSLRSRLYATTQAAVQLVQLDSTDAAFEILQGVVDTARVAFSSPDTIEARALAERADLERRRGAYRQAIVTAREATRQARAVSDTLNYALGRSLYALGATYRRTGPLDSARTYLRQALHVRRALLGPRAPETASAIGLLGVVHAQQGQYADAETAFKKALTLEREARHGRHPDLSTYYSNLGSLYRLMGWYKESIEMTQAAIETVQSAPHPSQPALANLYNNLGNAYAEMEDYASATAQHENALALWKDAYGTHHATTARGLSNQGIVLMEMGRYDDAQRVLQRALEIATGLFDASNYTVQHYRATLAEAYRRGGRLDRAHSLIQDAIEAYEAQDAPLEFLTPMYSVRGDVLFDLERYEEAQAMFETLLSIQQDVSGRTGEPLASAHFFVAKSLSGLGRVDEALRHIDRALEALRDGLPPGARALSTDDAPDGYEVLLPFEAHFDLLYARVILYSQRADSATTDAARRQALDSTLHAARHALAVGERVRVNVRRQASKLRQIEKDKGIHEIALRTALDLHAITDEPRYAQEAFTIAESAKAALFLETLSKVNIRGRTNGPHRIVARLDSVEGKLRAYRRLLVEASTQPSPDSGRVQAYQNQVQMLADTRAEWLERLRTDHADAYALTRTTDPASIESLRRTVVDSTSAIVEYFTGADTLYTFALTSDTLAVRTAPLDALRGEVQTLRTSIVDRTYGPYVDAAHRIYEVVFEPVHEVVRGKTVTLVPDGVLHYVPFETLLTDDGSQGPPTPFSELPYLLRTIPIRYAPSATVLQRTLNRDRAAPSRRLLAMAPVDVFAGSQGAQGPQRSPTLALATRNASGVGTTDSSPFARDSSKEASGETHGAATGDGFDGPPRAPAPNTIRAGRTMPSLPGSRSEVQRIADLFSTRAGWVERWFASSSETHLGRDATEARLTRHAGDYRYLHLATHSIVRADHPELTRVLLAPPSSAPGTYDDDDGDDANDGVLYLGEVYGLTLRADLVTLSACDTGLGRIAEGEGLIGLTRGFLHAGARSVLVSLWPVQDRQTADLMVAFYDAHLSGQSKAEALQTAKLDLIDAHPLAARPYYWAGFVLAGQ